MWAHLERGSSPVDWCESNYSISPDIAEFVNTVSNVLFFLFPPVLIHLFRQYSRLVNPAINVLWLLLMVVGMSSAYFHATLSLVGQLLDELAILWVCMAAFAMFLPRRYFPKFLGGNRRALAFYSSVFSVISTGLLVMHPAANAFVLMTLALPAIGFLFDELKRFLENLVAAALKTPKLSRSSHTNSRFAGIMISEDKVKCVRVYRLGLRCAAVWLMAVFCWIVDRLFCETFLSIDFPYLHAVWHILIFIASYTALVLFAFFNVQEEKPQQKPQLRYWPQNTFELGIPYVTIKHASKDDEAI